MISIVKYPKPNTYNELLKRSSLESASLEATVNAIINNVKTDGDKALYQYSKEFDKADLSNLIVNEEEFTTASENCSSELKNAISIAYTNIYKFHDAQKTPLEKIETMPGVICWRKSVPIEKIGIYIPGGSAPLFSTILMLGIPAKIAGCNEIILCTPPDKNGNINPVILYTAKLVGITKVFKVGGAQAIAALAYGTESIPKVFKIFGPGNQYVTCAKQVVSKSNVAIDMPAGPSELAIYADETANPTFIAADLLSQAEHGIDSQVILVSALIDVIEKVNLEIQKQLNELPRKSIASEALKNSKAILVASEKEAIDLLNEYAPEHLIIASKNSDSFSEQIINAGSIFLGNFSCESAGDYASGTNHTLPTNGYAKSYSGVSLDSFVKKITFQKINETGIKNIGPSIEIMANAEGLQAHKNAVTVRLNYLNSNK